MHTKSVIVALAVVLATPTVALATWGGKGGAEPDTKLDATQGWMFPTNDITPVSQGVNKVYFNGFLGQPADYGGPAVNTALNPNLATLGTGIPTFPDSPKAMLGVWKDCNKDGYIGLGDNALLEYRVELLLNDYSVCPKQSIPSPIPQGWYPVHNDGTWVHEFTPIGVELRKDLNQPDPDPWNIVDMGAKVWVDDGVPGSPPSGTCYTTAHPIGTFHTVGGMVALMDCYASGRVDSAGTTVACGVGQCATWTTAKSIHNPWGEENEQSDVNAWDCGRAPIATLPTEAKLTLAVNNPRVPPKVNAPANPTSGDLGLGATMNATGSGLTPQCSPWFASNATNPGQALADAPYSTESDSVNDITGVKFAPDFILLYQEAPAGTRPPPVVGSSLGQGAPDDLGEGNNAYGREFWGTGTVRAVSRNPILDRTLIAPQKVTVYTYYAEVSPTAISTYSLTLPTKGAAGGSTYGLEACGTHTSGVWNSWQCDPTKWYPQGTRGCLSYGSQIDVCSRIGDAYDMRDVDCYDYSTATARGLGVGYGLLTNTKCP